MKLNASELKWIYYEDFRCYALEGLCTCAAPVVPELQSLNLYVPEVYIAEDGSLNEAGVCCGFTAKTAPVVFENGIGGYGESHPDRIGSGFNGPKIPNYLRRGFVYVSPGARGRQTRDAEGRYVGRAPLAVVDLKAAVRFLKKNRDVLPGNMERIVSVGFSAGGAMSALLGVTGDQSDYAPYLRDIGAVMDESDRVYAAQCYVPVMNLDRADLAYEWEFAGFEQYRGNMFHPSGSFGPFERAISQRFADRFAAYVDALALRAPDTGEPLTASGEDCSLRRAMFRYVGRAAQKHLEMIRSGQFPGITEEDYLCGNYSVQKFNPFKRTMETLPGEDHRAYLSVSGEEVTLSSLHDLLALYRQRMKECPAFDTLDLSSFENQEFSDEDHEAAHFNADMAEVLEEIKDEFPEEYARYRDSYESPGANELLLKRKRLLNPMTMALSDGNHPAAKFRIRMGAKDADTAWAIPLLFAAQLVKRGVDTDYALVWDVSHEPVDCGDELYEWIAQCARE